MLGTSYGLELSKRLLNEHRNPEETEEIIASSSLKDESHSSVLIDLGRKVLGTCSKFSTTWSKKKE